MNLEVKAQGGRNVTLTSCVILFFCIFFFFSYSIDNSKLFLYLGETCSTFFFRAQEKGDGPIVT